MNGRVSHCGGTDAASRVFEEDLIGFAENLRKIWEKKK